MSSYEAIRLRNLEDNKRVLASFGLLDPFLPFSVRKGAKRLTERKERPRKRPSIQSDFIGGSIFGAKRKSARLEGKEACSDPDYCPVDDEEDRPAPRVPANRPNFYGSIPGVPVGTFWDTRMECCRDGIHRPTVAGIHGGENGAYSIALSGGYEDDIDLGECFTYTGEGGRDLKGTKSKPKNLRTAPQSKDQTLTRGNLALSKNVETKNPVRVIRGYKLDSPFAPDDGYRYDGLYSVEKSWFTTGLSGFGVWKFALKRLADQEVPPWQLELTSSTEEHTNGDANEEVDKALSESSKDDATEDIFSSQSSNGSDRVRSED